MLKLDACVFFDGTSECYSNDLFRVLFLTFSAFKNARADVREASFDEVLVVGEHMTVGIEGLLDA